MRDQFWTLFCRIKFTSFYLSHYQRRVKTINNFIDSVSLITSASCIAAWNLWDTYSAAWSILVGAAQVLQIIKSLFPYSKRLHALVFIIPEIKELADQAETLWNHLASESDSAFEEPLSNFRSRFTQIESKYLGSDSIPTKSRLSEKAMKETELYFRAYQQGGN